VLVFGGACMIIGALLSLRVRSSEEVVIKNWVNNQVTKSYLFVLCILISTLAQGSVT
jgi:hypothetical protein